MNVLVACEESQRVCSAFRAKGHNAFSCDLLPCSGGFPEYHIQQNVLSILNPERFIGICFNTCDGEFHRFDKWDLIIAFPPCTFLTVTGNRWFNVSRYGDSALARLKERKKAIDFFMQFVNARCDRIAIENPIGVMSSRFRKPDQIVHPYQFAFSDAERYVKSTCLWLKNLSPLQPLHTQKPDIKYHTWIDSNGRVKRQAQWYYNTRCLPYSQRSLIASKTPYGLAEAMAEQWG